MKLSNFRREAGPLPSSRAMALAEVVACSPGTSPEVSCFRAAEDLVGGELYFQ